MACGLPEPAKSCRLRWLDTGLLDCMLCCMADASCALRYPSKALHVRGWHGTALEVSLAPCFPSHPNSRSISALQPPRKDAAPNGMLVCARNERGHGEGEGIMTMSPMMPSSSQQFTACVCLQLEPQSCALFETTQMTQTTRKYVG